MMYVPQIHELKTWSKFFTAIDEGNKTFEVRNNDRNYQVGDLLILRDYLPDHDTYTNYVIVARVTYVMADPTFVKQDFVILGFRVLN